MIEGEHRKREPEVSSRDTRVYIILNWKYQSYRKRSLIQSPTLCHFNNNIISLHLLQYHNKSLDWVLAIYGSVAMKMETEEGFLFSFPSVV